MRLADWFRRKEPESHVLPMNPRASRSPIPPESWTSLVAKSWYQEPATGYLADLESQPPEEQLADGRVFQQARG